MIKSVEAEFPHAALEHLRAAQALLDNVAELGLTAARLSMIVHEVEEYAADCLLKAERFSSSSE